MKEFIKKIMYCHKTLHLARMKGNKSNRGFLIKDTFITVYIEIIACINSVFLIKYVLDYAQLGINFYDTIPFFCIIVLLNLFSMCLETYRDNVLRTSHIHKLSKDISKDYYKKLIKLPYAEQFNQQAKDATLFAYFNAALAIYNSEIIVSTYIGYFVTFIVNFIIVIVYGSYMGLLILLVFLALTIWIQKIVVQINKIEFDYLLKNNQYKRRLLYYKDSIFLNKQSNQVLKIEDSLNFFLNKYENILSEQKDNNTDLNKKTFSKKTLKNHIFYFLYYITYFLIFSYKLIVLKSISIGSFWACYKSCLSVFESNIIHYYGTMEQVTRYIDQVNLFFDIPDEDQYEGTLNIDPETDFEVVFEHVAFSYPGKRRKVLKDINLKIKKGENIVLLGENGAGKTTILLLLYRLLRPSEGRILLNGIEIENYDIEQYRNLINIMFQDFKLYPYPLASNIILQNEYSEKKEKIYDCINRVGLEQVVKRLEKGIDTHVTKLFEEDGYVPSGGETSKIGFAQQLINENGIFIFDEYDSNIDPISEKELNERILSMGKTKVIISHRLSIAKEADRIYWIEKGKTVEEGSHVELCELNGRYANLYEKRKNIVLSSDYGKTN